MRFFVDCEFKSFDACQLISVAIVGKDKREFYGECSDFERPLCSDFVRNVVLPQLGRYPGRSMPFPQLRSELMAWLHQVPTKPAPVLCFDFQGDLQLVEHLIGAARYRAAGKPKTSITNSMPTDAWRTSHSTGASITPCMMPGRMPVRTRGNSMRLSPASSSSVRPGP